MIPLSCRLLWRYFGRIFPGIAVTGHSAVPGSDRVAVAVLDAVGHPIR